MVSQTTFRGRKSRKTHDIPKEVNWTRGTHCLASAFAGSQSMRFFSWGHLKLFDYATHVDTPEDLIARIVVVAADIERGFERVRESFLRRRRQCNDVSDRHFQQLL
ncbi:hypothetical protein AVEN_2307-1 [Araneus ventricosus]|uniref:Uncharacterized protein n=1 Tax=Araneus ventricosus TaxID=182803 RepID=A0A4Y2PBF3_ARAVE|nr:hypothetical protein AVEN_147168-1 [Araneus ventricosus]GBN48313.1 hypothetical protein AVEN_2307-1 [Araneus ventricosus]